MLMCVFSFYSAIALWTVHSNCLIHFVMDSWCKNGEKDVSVLSSSGWIERGRRGEETEGTWSLPLSLTRPLVLLCCSGICHYATTLSHPLVTCLKSPLYHSHIQHSPQFKTRPFIRVLWQPRRKTLLKKRHFYERRHRISKERFCFIFEDVCPTTSCIKAQC